MNGNKIKKWALIFFLIFFVLYGLFESYRLLSGPKINISEPINGTYFEQALISVKGTAKNISFLSLDDRQIFIDKNQAFDEKLILVPGYNIMKIRGEDRFGKVVEKKMQFFLKRPDKPLIETPSHELSATSTSKTSTSTEKISASSTPKTSSTTINKPLSN